MEALREGRTAEQALLLQDAGRMGVRSGIAVDAARWRRRTTLQRCCEAGKHADDAHLPVALALKGQTCCRVGHHLRGEDSVGCLSRNWCCSKRRAGRGVLDGCH